MGLVGCVLLLVLGAAVAQDSINTVVPWNRIMDGVLSQVNEEQIHRGRQELELKDLDREFKEKLGFLRLRGRFTADGGWLSDISTARREGDVTSEIEGEVVRLNAAVSWADLRLGYRHYKLDIGRDIEGSLEVKAKRNLVRVIFAFELVNGECKTSLEYLKIEDLSDFDVKITGLGFLNFLVEKIGIWFIERRKDDILTQLEDMFKSAIPEHLEEFYCDEYATILQVPL